MSETYRRSTSLTQTKEDNITASREDLLSHLEQFGWSQRRNSTPNQNSSDDRGGSVSDDMVVIDVVPGPKRPAPDKLEDFDSISVSTSYSGEWEKLFIKENYMKNLRAYGMQGKLRSTRFRSVCWKLYLEVLPEHVCDWQTKQEEWRDKYTQLKNTLIVNPRKEMDTPDLSVNNPLSQEVESPWNQFFQDNELRLTIKQDVVRTYPKIEFYHKDEVRTLMVDILFVYAKLNPDVAYRQGMHELLAPLIFVLHCDHQAFLHACEIESFKEIVRDILDPKYIEHDAFALFYQIMETVEPWYVSKEVSPTVKMSNVVSAQPFARSQDLNPSNVIITKLTRIQDYLLKKFDPELHAHLERMEIPPQIYGIRWVRLLFGREFPMQDLLMMWDAVFADGISFDLVDYVFVAMLLYLRDAMLSSDYPSCLGLLMKYPPVGDVQFFVQKAIYLREPNDQPRPPEYTYHLPATLGAQHHHSMRGGSNVTGMMSGFSTLTRNLRQGHRPRTLGSSSRGKTLLAKSTSEPMNLITDTGSPGLEIPYIRPSRKGSTSSMSQIEDGIPPIHSMRPTLSSQSLARLETTSMRSNGSNSSLSQWDHASSPGDVPRLFPGRGGKKARKYDVASEQRHELRQVMERLNELEVTCRRCADRMENNISKLQREMLQQHLHREDELLLAIAGLKQVRDVLKGTLKPSVLYDYSELDIRDDHYNEPGNSLTPRSVSMSATPMGSPTRPDHPMSESLHGRFYVSSAEVSDADMASPDIGPDGAMSTDSSPATAGSSHQGASPPEAPPGGKRINHQLEGQREVELLDLQNGPDDVVDGEGSTGAADSLAGEFIVTEGAAGRVYDSVSNGHMVHTVLPDGEHVISPQGPAGAAASSHVTSRNAHVLNARVERYPLPGGDTQSPTRRSSWLQQNAAQPSVDNNQNARRRSQPTQKTPTDGNERGAFFLARQLLRNYRK